MFRGAVCSPYMYMYVISETASNHNELVMCRSKRQLAIIRKWVRVRVRVSVSHTQKIGALKGLRTLF